MLCPRLWLALAVLLALSRPQLALAEPRPTRTSPRATVSWSSGYASGIEANRHVHEVETRWGADYRALPSLSLGLEAALVRFVGRRDERPVSSLGPSLLPVVGWHFLRLGNASLALDLGLGAAVFLPELRPRGATLNGCVALGLQGRLPLRRDVLLLLGVRAVRYSQGRFLGSDEASFDGLAFNIGAGFGVGR